MLVRSAATAFIAAAALAFGAGAAEGPVVATDNVEARLVAEVDAVAPGSTVLVGLHKIIRPHWHTYWRNPGDAGEPTQLTFDAPAGVEAGGFIWPVPNRIPVGDVLLNYGYEGELLLPLELTVPADARPGETLSLQANAFWLVCETICIPEDVNLTLDLPIADAAVADAAWGPTLQEQVAAAPQNLGFEAAIERAGDKVRLTVADSMLTDAIAEGAIRDVQFFPFAGDVIVPAAPQEVRFGARGVELTMTPNFGLENELKPVDGVLAFEAQRGGEWARTGVEIAAAVGAADIGAIVATARPFGGGGGAGGVTLGLVQAALFAFIGGLILNLMPCVFPVLSIKALGVIGHAHGERSIARKHGVAFLLGVLATFTALAIALIALKAAGASIGWGFQLQSPAFVTGIAVLFFVIGLNLLGFFEFGGGLQNVGGGAAALQGPAGSFATGALAVLAASPCTAPFMSVALPAALASPAPQALAIFLALGLGFAAPFTLLSFFPGWARVLPKPGAWMERLKQLFAFPMFATAVWLLWVLTVQAGANGLLGALVVMVGVSFLIWAFRSTRDARPPVQAIFRVIGVASFVVALAIIGSAYGSGTIAATTTVAAGPASGGSGLSVSADEAWSEARVAELRAEGRPVFVDFTAAWCITCQFNKRVALKTQRAQDVFAATNTAQLVADWTNRDATIAAELDRYNRAGVPLYLLFPPEGDVIVLNEILTEQQVIDALERAAAT